MKVKCIANSGVVYKNYKMPDGFFVSSEFAIEIDKNYLVLGMLLSEGIISYLIDEDGVPRFLPFQLFEVIEKEMSDDWHFKVYSNFSPYYPYRQAIWGYEALLNDDYLDSLLEREDDALSVYFQNKIRFEEEENKYLS